MPTYDYHCPDCGHHLEKFHKISDEPLKECPSCNQQNLKRGIGGGTATLMFKGKGFYITDYKNEKESSSKAGCACKGTHQCG